MVGSIKDDRHLKKVEKYEPLRFRTECPTTEDEESPADAERVKWKNFYITSQRERPTILPNNLFYVVWKWFYFFIVFFDVTLSISFLSTQNTAVLVYLYLSDAFALVHIFISFFVIYYDDIGIRVNLKNRIGQHYLTTRCLIDLVAVLPTDYFALLASDEKVLEVLSLLRINRLLRIYYVYYFFSKLEEEIGWFAIYYRLAKYAILTPIFIIFCSSAIYLSACMPGYVTELARCRSRTWAFNAGTVGSSQTTEVVVENITDNRYTFRTAVYWAVTTITLTGFGDLIPVRNYERWISVIIMLAATIFLFGILAGGLAAIFTSLEAKKVAFLHRFQKIIEELSQYCCDDIILNQLLKYYEFLWIQEHGIDTRGLYRRLPFTFQAEISYGAHENLLKKVQLLYGLDEGFFRMVSLRVRSSRYLPKQIISNHGDLVQAIYFLKKGEIEVLSDDDKVLAKFKPGELFGEIQMALLMPRNATLRAVTHSEVLMLTKRDLFHIASQYPKHLQRIQIAADEKCKVIDSFNIRPTSVRSLSKIDAYTYASNFRRSFRLYSFTADELRLHPLLAQLRKINPTAYEEIIYSEANPTKHSSSITRRNSSITRSLIKEDIMSGKITSSVSLRLSEQPDRGDMSLLNFDDALEKMRSTFSVENVSPMTQMWNYILSFLSFLIAVCYPLLASYYNDVLNPKEFRLAGLVIALMYMAEVPFIVNLLIFKKSLVRSRKTPSDASMYIKTRLVFQTYSWMVFCLQGVLPFEIFSAIWHENSDDLWFAFALLKLNRLLLIHIMFKGLWRLTTSLKFSLKFKQVVKISVVIIVYIHFMACLAYAITCRSNEDCALLIRLRSFEGTESGTLMRHNQYTVGVYWIAGIVSSTGYGDIVAVQNVDRIFAIFAMLMGWMVFAYSAAVVTATLSNLDLPRVKYQNWCFAVNQVMCNRGVAPSLRQNVRNYLKIMWERYAGEWLPGNPSLIAEAPESVLGDISIQNYYWLLNMIPMFQDLDEGFLRAISSKLIMYIFSPGEAIVYAGDLCKEMYIIKSGTVQYLTPQHEFLVEEITAGHSIGEIPMLFRDYQLATVRAKTHVEALELKLSDLQTLLSKYPIIRNQFIKLLKRKKMIKTVISEVKKVVMALDNCAADSSCKVNLELWFHGKHEEKTDSESEKFYKFDEYDKDELHELEVKRLRGIWYCFYKMLLARTFDQETLVYNWVVLSQTIIAFIHCLTIPVQLSFLSHSISLHIFHWLLDFISIINIYLSLHLVYYGMDTSVRVDSWQTAKYYARHNLAADVWSVMPLEIIGIIIAVSTNSNIILLMSLFKVNRLLHIYRIPYWFAFFEANILLETDTIRLVKFLAYGLILLLWQAVVIFSFACPPSVFIDKDKETVLLQIEEDRTRECYRTSWLVNLYTNPNSSYFETSDLFSIVTASLYFTTATCLGVGYGDVIPVALNEEIVMTFIKLTGLIFFIYLNASITASYATVDLLRSKFQEKVQAVFRFLKFEGFKKEFLDSLNDYYNEYWIRHKGTPHEKLFFGLNPPLYSDLTYQLYGSILESIPFFTGIEKSFLKNLSKYVESVFFLKGQLIVQKGDRSDDVFYIYSGTVEAVLSTDKTVSLGMLTTGSIFGHDSWFFKKPRPSTIIAKSNCDLLVLSKAALDVVVKSYPRVGVRFGQLAHEERMRTKILEKEERRLSQTSQDDIFARLYSTQGEEDKKKKFLATCVGELDPESFIFMKEGDHSNRAKVKVMDDTVSFDLFGFFEGVSRTFIKRKDQKIRLSLDLPAVLIPRFLLELAVARKSEVGAHEISPDLIKALAEKKTKKKQSDYSSTADSVSETPSESAHSLLSSFKRTKSLSGEETEGRSMSVMDILKLRAIYEATYGDVEEGDGDSKDQETTGKKDTKVEALEDITESEDEFLFSEQSSEINKMRSSQSYAYSDIKQSLKRQRSKTRLNSSSSHESDKKENTNINANKNTTLTSKLNVSGKYEKLSDEKFEQTSNKSSSEIENINLNANALHKASSQVSIMETTYVAPATDKYQDVADSRTTSSTAETVLMGNWSFANIGVKNKLKYEFEDSIGAITVEDYADEISFNVGCLKLRTVSPKNIYVVCFQHFLFILKLIYVCLTFFGACFFLREWTEVVIPLLYLCDVLFMAEMLLKCIVQKYSASGVRIVKVGDIVHSYLHNFGYDGFTFDMICVVPIEVLCLIGRDERYDSVGGILGLWRFLRCKNSLRLFQVFSYFNLLEQGINLSLLAKRFLNVTFPLIVTLHTLGCFWHLIGCEGREACQSESWLTDFQDEGLDLITRYTLSVYWCLSTMTTTGFGDIHATNNREMWYAIVVMVMGKIYLGSLLSNIASAQTLAEQSKYEYDQKLEVLKTHMNEESVPKRLQKKVIRYYSYWWMRNRDNLVTSLFDELPKSIQTEINYNMSIDFFEYVPLFSGTPTNFQRELSHYVKLVMFMPGDNVVIHGDIGTSIYFIHRGEIILDNVHSAGKKITLGEGEYLGEINLLYNTPRRISARALTYVDILTLSKRDFFAILAHFPEAQRIMRQNVDHRFSPSLIITEHAYDLEDFAAFKSNFA